MNTHRAVLPALLLAAALPLAGCSSVSASGPADADPGATGDANASAKPSASQSSTAHFGQTYTYDDGLKLTVTDKGALKPSSIAKQMMQQKWKHFEKFQVTVDNGTKKMVDLNLASVSMQDGEEEAEQVFDSESGLNGSPQTKLLPGRTKKWVVGFGSNTSDLVVQVRPDFDHDDALFTSK